MRPASVTGSAAAWVVSPSFDLVFFTLSAVVVVPIWLAANYFAVDAYVLLSIVAVGSNGPHLASTWTRVYLDPDETRRRSFAVVGVPLLTGAVVVTLVLRRPDAYRILMSTILYWATWHFAAQCYGLLRIYGCDRTL